MLNTYDHEICFFDENKLMKMYKKKSEQIKANMHEETLNLEVSKVKRELTMTVISPDAEIWSIPISVILLLSFKNTNPPFPNRNFLGHLKRIHLNSIPWSVSSQTNVKEPQREYFPFERTAKKTSVSSKATNLPCSKKTLFQL